MQRAYHRPPGDTTAPRMVLCHVPASKSAWIANHDHPEAVMASQQRLREQINNQIITSLESGNLPPWRRPWRLGRGLLGPSDPELGWVSLPIRQFIG